MAMKPATPCPPLLKSNITLLYALSWNNVHQNKMLSMYSKVPCGVTMHWYDVQV